MAPQIRRQAAAADHQAAAEHFFARSVLDELLCGAGEEEQAKGRIGHVSRGSRLAPGPIGRLVLQQALGNLIVPIVVADLLGPGQAAGPFECVVIVEAKEGAIGPDPVLVEPLQTMAGHSFHARAGILHRAARHVLRAGRLASGVDRIEIDFLKHSKALLTLLAADVGRSRQLPLGPTEDHAANKHIGRAGGHHRRRGWILLVSRMIGERAALFLGGDEPGGGLVKHGVGNGKTVPLSLPQSQQGILCNARIAAVPLPKIGGIRPKSFGVLGFQQNVHQRLHFLFILFGVRIRINHQVDPCLVVKVDRRGGLIAAIHLETCGEACSQ